MMTGQAVDPVENGVTKGVTKIQEKFLNEAMKNKDTMMNNIGGMSQNGEDGEATELTEAEQKEIGDFNEDGKIDSKDKDAKTRSDFLDAQSKFQANMQMFNNIANMTATTLKTLGEACTSLSRKQ